MTAVQCSRNLRTAKVFPAFLLFSWSLHSLEIQQRMFCYLAHKILDGLVSAGMSRIWDALCLWGGRLQQNCCVQVRSYLTLAAIVVENQSRNICYKNGSKGSYRVLGLTIAAIPGVFDRNRFWGEPGDKVFSSMETVESLQEENCFCTRVKKCWTFVLAPISSTGISTSMVNFHNMLTMLLLPPTTLLGCCFNFHQPVEMSFTP